jgi:autotransporter-associated beta strand protein
MKIPAFFVSSRAAQACSRAVLGICTAAAVIAPGVQAATFSWDADAAYNNGTLGGTGTWDTTTANWDNASTDTTWTTNTITGDTALFAGTAGTVTLGAAINALGLQFTTTGYTIAGANTLSLGTGGIDASTLTSGTTTISATTVNIGAAQSWNVGSGSTLAVSSLLTGSTLLTKTGAGTLTLSGTSTGYTAGLSITGGTVNLTGQLSAGSNQGAKGVYMNAASGQTTIFNTSGTIGAGATFTGNAAFVVGDTAGGTNIFNMTGGFIRTQASGTNPASREFWVGRTGFGVLNVSGGTLDSYGWFCAGIVNSGAIGIVNITGGTVEVLQKGTSNVGSTLGASTGATGVLNINGGTFNSNAAVSSSGIYVGENATGVLNVSGTAAVNLGGTAAANNLKIGANNTAGVNGTVNLGAVGTGGGTITTGRVWTGGTTAKSYFDFHGGTLKSSTTPNAAFMTGLTGAYVYGEGGTIDNNSQTITIGQNMLAPASKGAGSISTTGFGTTTGYTTAPFVAITGGSGTGMTANAVVDGSGNLTGFTITNPGTGYLAGDTLTVTLSGGGYATTSTSTTAITLADNTSGGLTFAGSGTTTLTGTSTYTGGTTVTAGTLALGNATDTLADTGAINVNGGTLSIGANSDTVGAVTLTSGNITGTTGVLTGSSYAVQSGTVSAILGGTGALTKSTTGTVTLSGANTYTGTTTVNAGTLNVTNTHANGTTGAYAINNGGTLNLTGALGGTAGVAVNGGGTLKGTGSTAGVITLAGGSTASTQGTLNLVDSAIVTTFTAGGLTVGGTNSGEVSLLNFDANSSSADLIALGGNVFTVNFGGANITITKLSGGPVSGQTINLITFGSGTGSGFTTGSGINVGSLTLTNPNLSFGVTGSLNVTATGVQLVTTGGASPTTAYWSGIRGSHWTDNDGTNGNFTTDQAGTTFVGAYPAPTTDIIFAGNGATNLANTLGQDFEIKSLTFANGTAATAISGSNTLTIDGASGITLQSGNGGATLGMTTLALGADQTWANASSGDLTVSSVISGSHALTINNTSTGKTILSGANTYSGGTTLTAGLLQLSGSGTLGSTSGALTVNGGTLDLNATSQTVGNLTGAGGTLLNNGNGAVTLTIGAGNGTGGNFQGVIANNTTGTGTVALTKTGTGTLQLSGANTYTGATTINGGTLQISAANNLGAGTSLVLNAATLDVTAGGFDLARAITLGGAGTLTVDSGTLTESGNITNGANLFTVSGAGNTTISGVLGSGTGGLAKTGAGTLTLSGTGNAYTGATTVDQGALTLSGTSTGAGSLTISNTGTMNVTGTGTFGATIVGNRSGSGILNVNGGTMNVTGLSISFSAANTDTATGSMNISAGTFTSSGDVVVGLGGTQTGKLVIDGGTMNVGTTATKWMIIGQWDTVSGEFDINGGNLKLNTNTAIKFSSANTGTAGTNVINQNGGAITFYSDNGVTVGGTGDLDLQRSGAAAVNNTFNLNGGTLTTPQVDSTLTTGTRTFNFNGGTLQAAKTNTTFFNLGTGSGTARANVRNNGAIIDTNTFDVTIAQALLHSNVGGDNATDGGLIKNSTGTLTLSGANTYNGNTTINAGTLTLANALALQNSTLASSSTGGGLVFDSSVTAHSFTFGGLSGDHNITLADNAGTPNAIALGIGGNDQSTTYSGVLSGAGSIVKNGAGTLILSGLNTYTGATTVNTGELRAGGTSAFGNTSAVTLANTAGVVLNLNNNNTTLGSLAGGGTTGGNVSLGSGTLTVGGNNTSTAYAGVISGTGGLTKIGSGTLTLDGTHTYTGATSITAGVLAGNGSFASATTVASGGRLFAGAVSTGASPMTFNNGLTFNSGSSFQFKLNDNIDGDIGGLPGVDFSSVSVAGGTLAIASGVTAALTFNAAGSLVDFTNTFWQSAHSWLVFQNANTASVVSTGIFDTITTTADGSTNAVPGTFTFTQVGNDVYLNFSVSAIPEPAAWAAILGSLTLIGAALYRRRRIAPSA